ncbi:MAG: hypothetical protein AAGU26_05890 [bacterium]|jgi:hypothetical protein
MDAEKLKDLIDALSQLGLKLCELRPELSQRPEYLNDETGKYILVVAPTS